MARFIVGERQHAKRMTACKTGKEGRKEKRKKNWKNNKAGNFSVQIMNDKRGMCFICNQTDKLTDLACALCNKFFHKKCVPRNYKMHIPEKDDDSYACHMFSVSRQFLWHSSGWFWIAFMTTRFRIFWHFSLIKQML